MNRREKSNRGAAEDTESRGGSRTVLRRDSLAMPMGLAGGRGVDPVLHLPVINLIMIPAGAASTGGAGCQDVRDAPCSAGGATDWIQLPPEDGFAFEEGGVDTFDLEIPGPGAVTRCCPVHETSADGGRQARVVRSDTWIEGGVGWLVACASV